MFAKTFKASLEAVGAGIAVAVSAQAAPIYFDFGDSSSPSAPSNYNDIFVNTSAAPPAPVLSIANAIDSTGAATGVALAVSGFYPGSNQSGTTTPGGAAGAIFVSSATRDNAFTHVGEFGGQPTDPQGVLSFTGLNNAMQYNFTFFASRTGVTDIRETQYTVNGSNSGSALLDASNNTNNVAQVSGILPSGGAITVLVNAGPNNNNGGSDPLAGTHFSYIGALCVNCVVPEPTSALLLAFGVSSLVACGRFRPARRLS